MTDGADIRFHLPPGPPIPPSTWRRRLRWPIRIGSAAVAALLVVLGVAAVLEGGDERSRITAIGAVTVDCGTRAAVGGAPVAFGDPVSVYDADADGAPLASTRLDRFRRLAGGACLAGFEIHDLTTVDVYVVQIGDRYRRLVPPDSLAAGYVFE